MGVDIPNIIRAMQAQHKQSMLATMTAATIMSVFDVFCIVRPGDCRVNQERFVKTRKSEESLMNFLGL